MTDRVMIDINEERHRQDGLWGEQNHSPMEWLVILGEEYGEACKEAVEVFFDSDNSYDNYREELVHAAAVAVAAIECLDRSFIKGLRE